MKQMCYTACTSLFMLFSSFAENLPKVVTFNEHIRPIFSNTCFNCHGPDEHEAKAHLQLHTFEAATQPRTYKTKSGSQKTREAVIVPGFAEKSLLWHRLSTDDADEIMPPDDFHIELSENEKELVKLWIEQGAVYQAHWSYEAIEKFEKTDVAGEIDRLVNLKLKEKGFQKQNSMDEKRVLIRRLSLDIRGLLPSIEETRDFLADNSEGAWEKLVDQFLASNSYGERMGVHWFDLVRYSNSVGFHGDQELLSAPYRDYVIQAFNENMPFDQFTREQLAGDLLVEPTQSQIIATAYNRLNKMTKEGGAQAGEYLAKYAADRVSNVSSVWLGSTLQCAECHNHKYDPFSAKDFYAMAAFFADIKQQGVYSGGNNNDFAPELWLLSEEDSENLEAFRKILKTSDKKSEEYKSAAKGMKALRDKANICLITETVAPAETRLLPRGNWMDQSGEVVDPAVPHFMAQIDKKGRATRLDLANWLCSEKNPLAARAFVNRIWNLFFGQGLSQMTEDLGSQGEWPVNLELLDFLARRFMDDAWDIKAMVKGIVMSKTYRLETKRTPEMIQKDPYNRYLARQSILRLNAEFIRDTSLQVSGLLNQKMGGRNVMPYQPEGYYASMNFNPFRYRAEKDDEQYRKGVYMHWQRTFLHPFLKNFDAPEREVGLCARTSSNTPLQALTLLNDPTFVEVSKALAQRVVEREGAFEEKLNWLFELSLGRSVKKEELVVLTKLHESQLRHFKENVQEAQKFLAIGQLQTNKELDQAELLAWSQVVRAILNLHEFIVRR